MKKILLIVSLITLLVLPISAQNSSYFNGRGVQRGYRGFADIGYSIGVGDFGEGRVELQTTHGYQFLPYFYMGAGVGVSFYHKSEVVSVPIFADLRADLFNNSITPFIDFKIGYAVADVEGFYMSPSIGCRFGLDSNIALNASVGYTMQKYNWSYLFFKGSENCGGLTIRLGVEF